MSNDPEPVGASRVLHAVVGHGLPTYFMNAVRSVRAMAPYDQLLIIDNASPNEPLLDSLRQLAEEDDQIDVIFRTANDVRQNSKVGSLYAAYEMAFEYALGRKFDLLHLLQADFQMLWWDEDVIKKANDIYAAHPRCVNIFMQFLQRSKMLTDDLITSDNYELIMLRSYGLTDTGLYHLGRWKAANMRFGTSEQSHATRYLHEGFEVFCHPWPTDAPIPWPAVIRKGVRQGREIIMGKPYLLRALPLEKVASLKVSSNPPWLEDVCIPWGWVCLTPMWTTDIDSIDYWVGRYRDARINGIRSALPRLELRGVGRDDLRRLTTYQYRPSLLQLFFIVPVREISRRLTHLH